MANKSHSGNGERAPARLLISRLDAAAQLQERIRKADDLLARLRKARSLEALESLRHERYSWSEFNHDFLSRIFDTSQYADQYSYVGPRAINMSPTPEEEQREEIDELNSSKRRLVSILERLPLIDEANLRNPDAKHHSPGNNVFIVHGHDDTLKSEVARFIEKLHLKAIILSEQANQGRTIIEKFEAHAETVDFAVVLLTPDDVGSAKGGETKSRARQNVILELGYFIGKISRQKVCALFKSGVELPSDILGVVYVPADGDWRLPLAREMKTAGLLVDLNLAV